jgi:hypothetical protein
MRQLSLAILSYESANKAMPPMASRNTGGGWWDDHGWYSLTGPYLGEGAWSDSIDFTVSFSSGRNFVARQGGENLKVHACPSGIGLQRNEWSSAAWARTLGNYVVNAGNTNYGQTAQNGPFLGAPFTFVRKTPLANITDGTTNTLMMSETLVLPSTVPWGGTYSDNQTSLGGQVFTGINPPNASVPDGIGYGRNGNMGMQAANLRYAEGGLLPLPTQLDNNPMPTYIGARSKHSTGVNASRCDASVEFYSNQIDLFVWRAMTSAQGGEPDLAGN